MLHYCIYQEERSSDNTSKLYTISSNIVFPLRRASNHFGPNGNLYISLCVCVFFFLFLLIWYVGLDNEIYHLCLLLMRDRERKEKTFAERLKCNNIANPIQCTEKRLTLTLTLANINLNTCLIMWCCNCYCYCSQCRFGCCCCYCWLYPPRFNIFVCTRLFTLYY